MATTRRARKAVVVVAEALCTRKLADLVGLEGTKLSWPLMEEMDTR